MSAAAAASVAPRFAPDAGKLGDKEILHEDDELCSDGENGSSPEIEAPSVPKVACDRCRRRKIKCDRHTPCSQCLRGSYQCSFPEPQKRVKRQRILVSSIYESKIEHMTRKIDDLFHLVKRLDVPPNEGRAQPWCQNVKLYEAVKPSVPTQPAGPDHEGIDTSLLSSALQVARLLESSSYPRTGNDSQANTEIRSSRQTLQAILDSHGRRGTNLDGGSPFARSLPPGMTFRDLPMPPMEKVLACMRMVQDRGITAVPWLGETKSLGDFTLILIQVCSPGPVTDVELIISLTGLYWIFTVCASWASSRNGDDLMDQASVCQSSLEVMLSNMNFWVPTTIDAVLAMYLAALYCLQKGKIYASWTLINKAVTLSQALGLHTAGSAPGPSYQDKHRRFCLFWSVYCLERSTAMRLARHSAINDHHVTIPRPDDYPLVQGLISTRQSLIDGVEMARILGNAYDDLFSPGAMNLPAAHRTTRGQAIAGEWRALIASKELSMSRLEKDPCGTIGEIVPVEFVQHATRATDYLILVVICRAALSPSSTLTSAECTAAARISLHEHITCIALLASYDDSPALYELWVNGGLLLFPFIPFNIIFCGVIETGNPTDLGSLKALVDALELLVQKPDYSACAKHLRIFRALYTVAAVHDEARNQLHLQPSADRSISSSSLHPTLSTSTGLPSSIDHDRSINERLNMPPVPSMLATQPWVDFGGMDLDPLGTHLGYWIQDSNQPFEYFGQT